VQDVLVAQGLTRRFGDLVAVDGVSLAIAAGETVGLLGPNGAGKTTTISMISGLLEPDAGTVTVAGERMTSRSVAAKRHLGYVPQDLAIYPDLTGRENLAFFGRLYDIERGRLGARVDEVLEVVGLADRADDRADEYSGGMKRRLNIGIGLLHRPTLLVLDEPTVGVDPQSRNAILESVEHLAGEGMGVLYTTHYMEEAERLCDRVAIIDEGRVMAEGTRRELVALVGGVDRVTLQAQGDLDRAVRALAADAEVEVASTHDGGIELTVATASASLARLLAITSDHGVAVQRVSVEEPDLETVFLHLTGKALRDA
jgi:ABC-2 type transport system ATP-binding protein